jgi:hypothetical protein
MPGPIKTDLPSRVPVPVQTIKVIAGSKARAMEHAASQVPAMKPVDAIEGSPNNWIVTLEKVA